MSFFRKSAGKKLTRRSCHAIEAGGVLLYTGQPWHPRLELIAGVLTSHKDGKPSGHAPCVRRGDRFTRA
ncbi:class I SAM-dependent methyltransferase family protein [Shigella flexneri]